VIKIIIEEEGQPNKEIHCVAAIVGAVVHSSPDKETPRILILGDELFVAALLTYITTDVHSALKQP
jgi:hypothetical protein